jgi:predicted DNA binding CopG/RHH family protein
MDAKKTLEQLHQKKQISINMKKSDLEYIKQRANDIGISYQNIIQALVHNYATGKLKLQL